MAAALERWVGTNFYALADAAGSYVYLRHLSTVIARNVQITPQNIQYQANKGLQTLDHRVRRPPAPLKLTFIDARLYIYNASQNQNQPLYELRRMHPVGKKVYDMVESIQQRWFLDLVVPIFIVIMAALAARLLYFINVPRGKVALIVAIVISVTVTALNIAEERRV